MQRFFTAVNDNFQMKYCESFLNFVQNIDCGYTLELPLTSPHILRLRASLRKKNVYPCKPQLYYMKWDVMGVNITETCLQDVKLYISRKHLHTKVTPDFHLTYSKNGGNLGLESKK